MLTVPFCTCRRLGPGRKWCFKGTMHLLTIFILNWEPCPTLWTQFMYIPYIILYYTIYCISMYIVLISFLQYITTSVISAETSIHDACGQNISNCSSARARSLLRHFSFSACQGARMKRTCSPQQLRHRLLRCQLLQG